MYLYTGIVLLLFFLPSYLLTFSPFYLLTFILSHLSYLPYCPYIPPSPHLSYLPPSPHLPHLPPSPPLPPLPHLLTFLSSSPFSPSSPSSISSPFSPSSLPYFPYLPPSPRLSYLPHLSYLPYPPPSPPLSSPSSRFPDHPSIDWTGQLMKWPCTNKSIEALQKLLRVRELTLRPRRGSLNFNPIKNQQAALGQICGDLALAACRRCADSKGPFVECVVVQGRFSKSCCNCHYSSQGRSCSFRGMGEQSLGLFLASTYHCLHSQPLLCQRRIRYVPPMSLWTTKQDRHRWHVLSLNLRRFSRNHMVHSQTTSISQPRSGPKEKDLRKRPTSSGDPATPPVLADLTTSAPL